MNIVRVILLLSLIGCNKGRGSLKIKGSDTEVNLVATLAEAYSSTNKQSFLSISGGGSGLGIASLLNGQTDIANSSRELNDDERKMFNQKKIALDTFVFAEDAIAFVVNANLPIDSLTTKQLSGLLDGTIKTWENLTTLRLPVTIYGRQSNSGTYDFVKNILGIRFSLDAREMNGNAQILEAIKADQSGIGYVGAGYVMNRNGSTNDQIKVLKIAHGKDKAYSPLDSTAVFKHQYYFRRHLYQFIRKGSSSEVENFLSFERSAAGAQMIRKAGYYPINEELSNE
ncbi:MAG: substrate-binding domain-containing protein [Chitinophagaceae bacterium]